MCYWTAPVGHYPSLFLSELSIGRPCLRTVKSSDPMQVEQKSTESKAGVSNEPPGTLHSSCSSQPIISPTQAVTGSDCRVIPCNLIKTNNHDKERCYSGHQGNESSKVPVGSARAPPMCFLKALINCRIVLENWSTLWCSMRRPQEWYRYSERVACEQLVFCTAPCCGVFTCKLVHLWGWSLKLKQRNCVWKVRKRPFAYPPTLIKQVPLWDRGCYDTQDKPGVWGEHP